MGACNTAGLDIPRAVALLILASAASSPVWPGEEKKKPTISPDPTIQKIIRTVIYAKEDEYDKSVWEAMKTLERMSLATPEILGPQLVYYGANASNEKEGIGMLVLMVRLGPDATLREAIVPLLESEDKKLRQEAEIWLYNIDLRASAAHDQTDPVQSSVMFYRKSLLAQKKSPPPGLVAYVFRRSPGHAMLLFGEIYSPKPGSGELPRALLWSQHLVNIVQWRVDHKLLQEGDLEKARKELETLSTHEGWYARRYVVEVLRDFRGLGTPEMIERLKKDAHPLVREPAKLLK